MKATLKLRQPVHAPNGKALLPAGAVLTDQAVAELIESSREQTFGFLKVMTHGSIADNLHRICQGPIYDRIFSDGARTRSLFSLLDQVELPTPLFEIIDFFKSSDPYTYRHILIVFALSMLLAQDFTTDPYKLQEAAQACPTHDMGKYCIPLTILKKTTLLGQSERCSLEHHAAAGYVLLAYYFKDPRHPAAVTARDHHERGDGSGYPRGIRLYNPIVEIVAVCDVFDALIAKRPYRPTAYDLRTALEELTDMADRGALASDLVKALINYNRKVRAPMRHCVVSREKRGKPPGDNLYRGVDPAGCRADPPAEDE
jgi:HD-GYP domain-containing protein (c-di-GMP phosphodiesterase class II)